jgi:hypothetical protein
MNDSQDAIWYFSKKKKKKKKERELDWRYVVYTVGQNLGIVPYVLCVKYLH